METLTCSIASNEIGATPVRSPGIPAIPNEFPNIEPSTVSAFILLSFPVKTVPREWGPTLVKSVIKREIDGRAAISLYPINSPAAPLTAKTILGASIIELVSSVTLYLVKLPNKIVISEDSVTS